MADDRETNGSFDPVVKPFVDLWSDYLRQANEATHQFFDGINGSSNAKTLQRKWFDAIAKSMDGYMRSPAFLQAMKHRTDAVVTAKQQIDDLATEVARNANVPTAGDISGLYERLHTHEHEILTRLGHIEEKLDAIEVQFRVGQVASP